METITETQLDSSKVYMKCPTCSNPYSVDPLDISTDQPTFDCLACDTRFFFRWPQPFLDRAVETFPLEMPLQMTQGESEPAIEEPPTPVVEVAAPQEAKAAEPEPVAKAPIRVQDEMELDLQEKWKSLLNHWEDEWWHQSFLSFCDKKSKLSFATSRYTQYLKDHPKDELARKMHERLKALSRSDLVRAHQVTANPPAVKPSTHPAWKYLKWWWPCTIALCLTLFMIGYTQPMYRNLVGLSLALFVFFAGVRYLLLPDRTK